MSDNKFFVVRDHNDYSITYFEYDKVKGYDLAPKNVKIRDAIDVNKMIIINPSLVQKLAFRKVNARFQNLVKLLMFVLSSDNDDATGETYHHALNEITKLRLEVFMKYKNKLKDDDFDMFNKKLDLLEQELKLRIFYLENMYMNQNTIEKEGKSR